MNTHLFDLLLTLAMVVYFLGAVALGLYGINCYVMIFLFSRSQRRQQEDDQKLLDHFYRTHTDDDLPVVTTQLPVFNEKYVIERLIKAVCAFDYPRSKHEIQVLDDSTDETVELAAKLVAEMRAKGYDIHHVHRTNRQGYKAGALSEGTDKAHGAFFAIFDADFVPPPDFLRRTVPFMVEDPGCGFVQARWGHRNREYSYLTKTQAIGIDGHFIVEQSARAWNGLFLNFNGTAGVWRRKAIEEAGGWKSDTITEDLDLSYRTQLAGWHGRFVFDAVIPAELPTNINAFKSQQQRWAKGSIQTAKKLLPSIMRRTDIPFFKRIQAVAHLTHYIVHPIIVGMTLLVLPLLIWGHRAFTPYLMIPLLGIMCVSMFAPSALYVCSQKASYPDWLSRLAMLPMMMITGIGLAVNNSVGVLQAIFLKHHGHFIRTPKLGEMAEIKAAAAKLAAMTKGPHDKVEKAAAKSGKAYTIPVSGMFLFEMFMGFWAIAAFLVYLTQYKFIVGPILLLHAIGFLYVGSISLIHDLRAHRFEQG